ncbi:hypothetical protein OSB04_023688 [Centaurea solstitialis]|uniref:Replication protein A 70 kDa DNA-binding subunit B/D first OB fold domain-containing protein n=1 Tax=Centaurea solstitialis TaxID=347529 RepID=A0AA38WD65_9ASTR|nr:hypothetical protein OSB04_023688 [Centaurea solstitialis]
MIAMEEARERARKLSPTKQGPRISDSGAMKWSLEAELPEASQSRTMDEKNITLIDNLDIQIDDFTVKVRIIRLWSQLLFKDPEQLYSIEMILMDEEGSKIHANVLQKWIPKFKKLLHEGAAIFIKNPTIARHVSKYKLIDNTNN